MSNINMPDDAFKHLSCDSAGAKHRRCADKGKHRGFNADSAIPAVNNCINASVKVIQNMLSAGRARFSGKPSPTCAQHVLDDLDGCIDAIIDGGDCRVGVESTVLSLVGTPTVLRPGGVTREMLESVIGHVDIAHAVLNLSLIHI